MENRLFKWLSRFPKEGSLELYLPVDLVDLRLGELLDHMEADAAGPYSDLRSGLRNLIWWLSRDFRILSGANSRWSSAERAFHAEGNRDRWEMLRRRVYWLAIFMREEGILEEVKRPVAGIRYV